MRKSLILKNFLKKRKCTFLNIGPMSKNIVDTTIDISDKYNIPLTLIASRRQIDNENFSGGYVNNWNTKTFADYVKKKSKKKNIFLARDHGGPWQNDIEVNNNYDLKKAMDSSKESFKSDIEAGFDFLHLDTSIDPQKKMKPPELFERLFELYEFCYEYSQRNKKEIDFEVGTEEQSGSTNTPEELNYNLDKINKFCEKNKITKPAFVVVQAGTKVMEMKNIGSFDSPVRVEGETPVEIQLPKMIEACEANNIMMKEHNTDYLSDESLYWHPKIGIHSANVAPEFGVAETKEIVLLLKKLKLNKLLDRFLEISYESQKWKKWMMPNSKTTDEEKSIICGHYNFFREEVKDIFLDLDLQCKKKFLQPLNNILKKKLNFSICRYLYNFNMLSK